MDSLSEYRLKHKYSNIKDIRGKVFHWLTVVDFLYTDKNHFSVWLCKCKCGNLKNATMQSLKTGCTKSCGCAPHPTPHNCRDLTGMVFGKLKVLDKVPKTKKGQSLRWRCLCECGGITTAMPSNLINNHTRHCGCIHKNSPKGVNKKHGHKSNGAPTSEYAIWSSMKARCLNPKNAAYKYYGGRGIKVCDRWVINFENFIQDMGRKPFKNYTLERIDVNGNYEPVNCKWASYKEQGNNRRNNRRITYNGETKNFGQWAETLGISHSGLKKYLNGGGIDQAIYYVKSRDALLRYKELVINFINSHPNERMQLKQQLLEMRKYIDKQGGVYRRTLAKVYGFKSKKYNDFILKNKI